MLYYGSKISSNMTKTPEDYLICHNVPIGRTGTMDYMGEEIGLKDKMGQKIKVFRNPQELFSKATIASFEGKPVTDDHPTQNLDVNTISMMSRGHIQNVRADGDFLLADMYITDAGLISKIENGKREVSCGYDAEWIPLEDGTVEQKQIIGNHVAVVQSGRAGSRVAIKDAMPDLQNKSIERSNKTMGKNVSKKILAAIGFKHFVQDAEPEEIAKAMDAMGETESPATQEKEDGALSQILAAIKGIDERLTVLEQSDKKVHEEVGADAELAGLEKEMETKDDGEASGTVEPPKAMDVEPEKDEEEKKAPAADSLKKFVQDMKPIIMAIPDEKARNEAAKKFTASVRDARAKGVDGYSAIVNAVSGNKKQAMDAAQTTKSMSQMEAATVQAAAWNAVKDSYKGGK